MTIMSPITLARDARTGKRLEFANGIGGVIEKASVGASREVIVKCANDLELPRQGRPNDT